MTSQGPVPVPAALRPYVATVVGYGEADLPALHRGLPGTTLTLVLTADAPLDVELAGVHGSRATRSACVAGLHDVPALIRQEAPSAGVYVELTLAGARALLGMPAAALAGGLHDLGELALPWSAELTDRVAGAGGATAREHAVLAVLSPVCDPGRVARRPVVDRAVRHLAAGRSVQRTAEEVGYGRRHLSSLVRAETGLPPSRLRRVGRLARARRLMLTHAPFVPLSRIAAEAGYADQAHLTRDWVDLAGCTPSTWLREELRFVQEPLVRPEPG